MNGLCFSGLFLIVIMIILEVWKDTSSSNRYYYEIIEPIQNIKSLFFEYKTLQLQSGWFKKRLFILLISIGGGYVYSQKGNINDTITIEKIEFIGKKKLIERKTDRLVFYVENSHASTGLNGLEVLQNTPKVDVSKGDIRLIGKTGLKIMIDGRLLNLSSEDLENYLKSLRSDNISKVEVITIPPAKYDAQGNSGIVNIILKKNPTEGWRGNVSSSFIQRSNPGFSSGVAMYHTGKKINMSVNLSNNTESKKINSNHILKSALRYRVSDIQRNDMFRGNDIYINIGYSVNERSNIGVTYNGNILKNTQTGEVRNLIKTNLNNSFQHSSYQEESRPFYNSLSAYYDLKMDTIGTKMSVDFNYLNKNNIIDKTFITNNNGRSDKSNYQSEAGYNVYSSNIDFKFPFEFGDVEAGVKYTHIKNNSSFKYYNFVTGNPILDSEKSNTFIYKENIYAFYLSFFKKIAEKLEIQGGVRFEGTMTDGRSEIENQKNYFSNFFPSVYLSYFPNENNTISLAYSKRIDRPNFYQVNPFRIYIDSYSYDAGNPNLNPSFTHNIELSYLYKNNLSSTIYFSYLKYGKDYVITVNDSYNSVVSQPINFYNQNTLGIDISYTYKPFKWFSSFNSFSCYYNHSIPYVQNIINAPDFSGYGAYVSSKNTIKLSNNILFTLNFFQNFPTKEGVAKSYNRASLDTGIRFLLMDKTLQLSISINDIFAQNRNRVEEYYSNYNYFSSIYNDIRNINLTFNYNFGNKKVKNKSRKSDIEEKTRL